MLADGRSIRDVAKETGLSFTQLKEIREVLPLYVEVRELEEKLPELRDEYSSRIKEFEGLQRDVERLKRERERLEEEVRRLKHEKERLEEEMEELECHSEEALRDIMEGVKSRLLWAKSIVDGILGELGRLRDAWLIHDALLLIKRIDTSRGIIGWVRPGYTCISDDVREAFEKIGEAYEKLRHSLEKLSKELSEALARIEATSE